MEKKTLINESETLFIPLYGKAEVHKYGDILEDIKAREIVESVDYDFSHVFKSRFLTIYMGIRAAILDNYVTEFVKANENAVVITLGCGLDSRCRELRESMVNGMILIFLMLLMYVRNIIKRMCIII